MLSLPTQALELSELYQTFQKAWTAPESPSKHIPSFSMRCLLIIKSIGFLIILTVSCRNPNNTTELATSEISQVKDLKGFQEFYDRFHRDSAYQMEHIIWPLQGNFQQIENGDLIDVKWGQNDWTLHQPMNLGNDFVQEIQVIGDGLVLETIRAKAGNYSLVRRFSLLGGDWNLIYYQESILQNDDSSKEVESDVNQVL